MTAVGHGLNECKGDRYLAWTLVSAANFGILVASGIRRGELQGETLRPRSVMSSESACPRACRSDLVLNGDRMAPFGGMGSGASAHSNDSDVGLFLNSERMAPSGGMGGGASTRSNDNDFGLALNSERMAPVGGMDGDASSQSNDNDFICLCSLGARGRPVAYPS